MSHKWMVESSEPASKIRPERDTAEQVRLELAVGGRKTWTCWSERMSKRRAVLSSEAETKEWPDGWNCVSGISFLKTSQNVHAD